MNYIGNHLDNLRAKLRQEILSYDANTIATAPEEELYNYFLEKYSIEPPQLKQDELYMEEEPKELPLGNRKGLSFTICVPFDGDGSILAYRPSNYTHSTGGGSKGNIRNNEITFYYHIQPTSPDAINTAHQHDVGMLAQNFKNIAHDVGMYNPSLPQIIRDALSQRKKEVESNNMAISAVKIPIKRRSDIPETYIIPEIRKQPKIETLVTPKARKPDPTLAEEEYENILTIVKDMSTSMERSPSTFSKLSETEIRDFFLVQLNSHYQGSATGETFNGKGKTDILIRYENENVFIAECKFWKGKKSLADAITQLLGYVVWRDTKTSVFVFHKGKGLTEVLAQIDTIAQSHPNYKSKRIFKDKKLSNETTFSYIFTNPSDKEKELILSILVYQINSSDE